MTFREVELVLEGQALWWERLEFLLAWMQANLINIHIPKGKSRLTVEKLLPRRRKRTPSSEDDTELPSLPDMDDAPTTAAQVRLRYKQMQEHKDTTSFLKSRGHERLRELVPVQDTPGEVLEGSSQED